MQVTRRDFLRYCGLSAAALGLSASELGRLAHALTAPGAPTVVWFHGSGCQGDSISLLNRIATSGPGTSVDDVLVNAINLQYHAVLMTLAGESAAAAAMKARRVRAATFWCSRAESPQNLMAAPATFGRGTGRK